MSSFITVIDINLHLISNASCINNLYSSYRKETCTCISSTPAGIKIWIDSRREIQDTHHYAKLFHKHFPISLTAIQSFSKIHQVTSGKRTAPIPTPKFSTITSHFALRPSVGTMMSTLFDERFAK